MRVVGPYRIGDHPDLQVIMFWWGEGRGFDMDYYDSTIIRSQGHSRWKTSYDVPAAWQLVGSP